MIDRSPLVSIVIPTYNHASYLAQAIDSILNQDYANIELIVLDDGSTDGTRAVLESYAGKFYWETQKNMGQSSTLNKGWSMAKGDILAYLSADDLLLPLAVSRSVACLQSHPNAVLSYCDFDLIDPNSRVVRRVKAPDYDYMEMVTTFICAPSAGAFFWRHAFVKTGGWNTNIHRLPDYDCWLRLGLYGEFVRIPESLAAFRVHEGSQSFSETPIERAEEALEVMSGFYALPNIPTDILAVKNKAMANAHLLVAQLHLRATRYLMAFREMFVAAKLSPSSLLSFRFLRMFVNGLLNKFVHRILWKIRGQSALHSA
jgi:glycosyltransferase involved in cell wall biosynthesis